MAQFNGVYAVVCNRGRAHPSGFLFAKHEHDAVEAKAKILAAKLNRDPKVKCGPHHVMYRPV